MHAVTSLLVHAIKLTARPAEQPVAVPRDDLLGVALDHLALDDGARRALRALADAQGGQIAPAAVGQVVAYARQAAAQLPSPAHEGVGRAARQLASIVALNHITRADGENRATLLIDSPDLFRYVDWLYIAGGADSPDTILLGAGEEGRSIEVTSSVASYAARRVKIVYSNGATYPRLHLGILCKLVRDEHPQRRQVWVQKPRPAYDLDLYTPNDRLIGAVRTRQVAAPSEIAGVQVTVRLAPALGATALATDILDRSLAAPEGSVRLRCIRLAV